MFVKIAGNEQGHTVYVNPNNVRSLIGLKDKVEVTFTDRDYITVQGDVDALAKKINDALVQHAFECK